MPSKREVQKRRVQAQKAANTRASAGSRRDRRRRLVIGGVVAFLAMALVLPLALPGLIALFDSGAPDDGFDADPDSAPQPAILIPPEPGEELTGQTPCPAPDGSSPRTTSFSTAPPLCIDPAVDYTATVTTDLGDVVITINPELDTEAANLFITAARYHVYDGNPFWFVYDVGLAIGASFTSASILEDEPDLGVGIEATAPATADAYTTGAVAMLADLEGLISSRFALITDDLGATTLAFDPEHPVIGSITDGLEVARAIVNQAGSPGDIGPIADVRIRSITIAEITS